ncbi:MAG: ABC transporter ATP-binding protein [Oscillospiraceae bacterium]|jgi:sn-glycerol 3-phosphate transport system ATP-binding protein
MGSIEIKHIKKSFQKTEVLKDITVSIRDGSFTILLGPSGCGKSTLLRILCGLEKPDSGEVWIAGRNVTDAEPKDRGVAMVFQNYALYPHMTALQNVEYCLKIQKIQKDERRRMAMDALKTVELEDQADKLPSQMSGGQRQRVALARAIVKKPEVFLMDEPLSNLDAKLRGQMRRSLLELHQKLGTTFVYVTHDQTEAMSMGDKIMLINEGRVIQEGSPKEMYTDPRSEFVAGFIGNPPANILKTPFGTVSIRPEDIRIGFRDKPDEKISGTYLVPGTVRAYEPMGSDILFDVDSGLGPLRVKAENLWTDVPDRCSLYIPRDKILYFDRNGDRLTEAFQESSQLDGIISGLTASA